MTLRRQKLSVEDAEAMALQGLTFLVDDPQRLVRFLSLTGLTPADLKGFAGDRSLQMALLDYLLGDESLLLVFASAYGLSPQNLAPAYELLAASAGQGGRSSS